MAYYTFITDKDLDTGMKPYFRNQILENGAKIHILETSEKAAFEILCDHLSSRYDLAKLFPKTVSYNAGSNYLTDDYVVQNDTFYKAVQNSTNQPVTNATYWLKQDPRKALLVIYAVNITIYFMVNSIDPLKVSQDMVNAYDDAMEKLKDIFEGKSLPDYPLKETSSAATIRWGSEPKFEHYI